jgi:hypothetical protein
MSSAKQSDSFLPEGGTRKQMIHRSFYVNSAESTRFLDIRVARRIPYTGFYRFQQRKTIDSFLGQTVSHYVITQNLPRNYR